MTLTIVSDPDDQRPVPQSAEVAAFSGTRIALALDGRRQALAAIAAGGRPGRYRRPQFVPIHVQTPDQSVAGDLR